MIYQFLDPAKNNFCKCVMPNEATTFLLSIKVNHRKLGELEWRVPTSRPDGYSFTMLIIRIHQVELLELLPCFPLSDAGWVDRFFIIQAC